MNHESDGEMKDGSREKREREREREGGGEEGGREREKGRAGMVGDRQIREMRSDFAFLYSFHRDILYLHCFTERPARPSAAQYYSESLSVSNR